MIKGMVNSCTRGFMTEFTMPKTAPEAPALTTGFMITLAALFVAGAAFCAGTETALTAWLQANPGGFVLADASEQRKWREPALLALRVVDSQPTGQDRILLLRR